MKLSKKEIENKAFIIAIGFSTESVCDSVAILKKAMEMIRENPMLFCFSE